MRVRAPEAVARAGDDDRLAVVSHLGLRGLVRREALRLLEQRDDVRGLVRVLRRVVEVGDLLPLRLDGGRREGVVRAEDGALGALPADLGDEAAAELEDASGRVRAVGVREREDERRDELGLCYACQTMRCPRWWPCSVPRQP